MVDEEIPVEYGKEGFPLLRHIEEPHGLAQRLALIRFYFKEEPKTIDDFVKSWSQLEFSLKMDMKMRKVEPKKG